jgi:glycerophosphoryl diester phosphodiesterase
MNNGVKPTTDTKIGAHHFLDSVDSKSESDEANLHTNTLLTTRKKPDRTTKAMPSKEKRTVNTLSINYFILLTLSLLIIACKPSSHSETQSLTPNPTPLIFSHRASSGLWIQNSRNAVNNTVTLFLDNKKRSDVRFHGIEVDIVLTKDNIPILAHDPWIHKTLCRRVDGQPLPETLIKEITLHSLQSDYLCGGIRDTKFPQAIDYEESIMSLDELLTIARKAPELMIYLDIKLQPPLTAETPDYARAIMRSLKQKHTPNPIFIEGPNAAAIQAYQQYAPQKITTVLSYPSFFAHRNQWLTGAKTAIESFFYPASALNNAEEANADAIASPIQVANNRVRKKLQKKGKLLIVFTPNTENDMSKACSSGANIIITDFPNLGPCLHLK